MGFFIMDWKIFENCFCLSQNLWKKVVIELYEISTLLKVIINMEKASLIFPKFYSVLLK